MRSILLVSALAMVSLTAISQPRSIPLVVSSKWLSEHVNDTDLVVLQVAFSRSQYKAGHIPGARFLWYNGLAISTPDASTEMPGVVQADTLLESLGITSKSNIVLVFAGGNVSITTRMLLAFTYFGFGDRIAFLDGGYERWKSEQRPMATDMPAVTRSSLELTLRPEVIASAEMIKNSLSKSDVAIVDARDKNFYDGQGGGVVRQGHIKGAKSIPFSTVLDSLSMLKDLSTLQKIFADAGIKQGDKVITYCHVGQQATVIYLVARLLGYDAAVYDGSFEDWNPRDDEYPVEKTVKPKT
jgi:thiosulfate/3-mercaptopyruvate sulfurtransferase